MSETMDTKVEPEVEAKVESKVKGRVRTTKNGTPPPSFDNAKIEGYNTRKQLHKSSGKFKYYYYKKPIGTENKKITFALLSRLLSTADKTKYVQIKEYLESIQA